MTLNYYIFMGLLNSEGRDNLVSGTFKGKVLAQGSHKEESPVASRLGGGPRRGETALVRSEVESRSGVLHPDLQESPIEFFEQKRLDRQGAGDQSGESFFAKGIVALESVFESLNGGIEPQNAVIDGI